MLTTEELEAILTSILDAISDDPKPDWKDSLDPNERVQRNGATSTGGQAAHV